MISGEQLVLSNIRKASAVPSHLQVAKLQNWHFASPFPDCITNHPAPVISIIIGSTVETFCKKIRWSRYTVAVVSFVIGKTVVTAAAGNRVRRNEAGKTTQLSQSCQWASKRKTYAQKHIYAFTQEDDSK